MRPALAPGRSRPRFCLREPDRRCHGQRRHELERSGRKADDALVLLDQPVAGERSHGLGVERCGSPRRGGDEPQRVCAALAKRAFEAGLLSERLVASAARRALRRQRTGVATRNLGQGRSWRRDRREPAAIARRTRARSAPGFERRWCRREARRRRRPDFGSRRRCTGRLPADRSGRRATRSRRSPAPHDGARLPAGCNRAPAIPGSRRRASPRRGRQAWASAPARRSSAESRAPPASAAASPRRRGSRTGRASLSKARSARSPCTKPKAARPRTRA